MGGITHPIYNWFSRAHLVICVIPKSLVRLACERLSELQIHDKTARQRTCFFLSKLKVSVLIANRGEHTVDGRNPTNQLRLVVFPILLQGFIHARWCRISSINSICDEHIKTFEITT